MKKLIYILIATLLLAGATGCSDDFLINATTERQAAGEPATEGAILSNLAAVYQILLFDSYAANQYNSIVLTSDLRSDDIFKGVAARVTNTNCTCFRSLPLLHKRILTGLEHLFLRYRQS